VTETDRQTDRPTVKIGHFERTWDKNMKPLNETNYSKYSEIVTLVLHDVPMATVKDIDATLFADWPEGDDHTRWMQTATAKEIADWAAGIVGTQLLEHESGK